MLQRPARALVECRLWLVGRSMPRRSLLSSRATVKLVIARLATVWRRSCGVIDRNAPSSFGEHRRRAGTLAIADWADLTAPQA